MHIEALVHPAEVGLSAPGLDRAAQVLARAVASGFVPGCATSIYREGKLVRVAWMGTRNPQEPSSPVERDTIFLVASVTKPIVCAGALLLLQEGAFHLEQPVCSLIPEFCGDGREQVQLRHLFTHTSGLPDQLPESPQLRGRQAPLCDFVRATCGTPLLFAPGTRVSYQSMGILLLGEIVERLTGQRLRDYLQERLFVPLEMRDTTLGLPPSGMTRVAYSLPAPFPPGGPDVGDDWNTLYWRDTGAPWGGLHSTVEDLGRFLLHMLGQREGPLSPALRVAMTRDQTATMPGLPDADKLTTRWGLGWRLGRPWFGDLVSEQTFGHLGATGTAYWADPRSGLACVLLTNQPRLMRDAPPGQEGLIRRYGNAVAAAIAEGAT